MTQTCILIGHPVGHSVSPAIHRAAYELLGIDAVYELRDAPTDGDVLALVEEIRIGKLRGANVTVPHKLLALRAADVLHESARTIGAANVLFRDPQGQVVAQNTDAAGLADELRAGRLAMAGQLGSRRTCLVLGSGGATRASVVAALMAGFSDVWVTARRFHPGAPEETWPGAAQFRLLGARLLPWPGDDPAPLRALAGELAAVIQATSAGMKGMEGGPELAALMDFSQFAPLVAYDLVYNPQITPFVREAARSGHWTSSGLGMLVGQAAHAIDAWFGRLPPKEPLLLAARKALGL